MSSIRITRSSRFHAWTAMLGASALLSWSPLAEAHLYGRAEMMSSGWGYFQWGYLWHGHPKEYLWEPHWELHRSSTSPDVTFKMWIDWGSLGRAPEVGDTVFPLIAPQWYQMRRTDANGWTTEWFGKVYVPLLECGSGAIP